MSFNLTIHFGKIGVSFLSTIFRSLKGIVLGRKAKKKKKAQLARLSAITNAYPGIFKGLESYIYQQGKEKYVKEWQKIRKWM